MSSSVRAEWFAPGVRLKDVARIQAGPKTTNVRSMTNERCRYWFGDDR